MILKKIIVDGNELYEPISFEDALKLEDKSVLVFGDNEEKLRFYNYQQEEKEESKEETEFEDENSFFNFNFDNLGKFLNKTIKVSGGKNNNIVATLPFLGSEELRNILEGIIKKEAPYQSINPVVVFPFLSKQDCDDFFKKFIDEKQYEHIYQIIPFVSKDALSLFVDEYIAGLHSEVNVDSLYPFMRKSDVKKVFDYILSHKNNK